MQDNPEFEVRFGGRTFMTVRDGQAEVQGTDYNTDLAKVARLIALLSDVLCSAAQMKDDNLPLASPEQDNIVYLNRRKA